MTLMDESFDIVVRRRTFPRTSFILLLGLLCLLTACGQRRLNVMRTPDQNLISIGYSADRSGSLLRANDDAQLYCERQKKDVVFIKQDTVYQGRYDEDVTATARTAGRIAGALGSAKGARAGGSLSSSTDYKTTFEFVCR
jgi:hypothetical protein